MPTFTQRARETIKKNKEQREKLKQLEDLLADLPEDVVKGLLKEKGLLDVPIKEKAEDDKMVEIVSGANKKRICPFCNSSIIQKYGKDSKGYPRFKCTACGRTFGIKKGLLVSNSSWSHEMWITFIQQTMMGQSLKNIQHTFESDLGVLLKEETLLEYRHRLLRAIMLQFSMPQLKGTVQIDETFFRENQKGSRELINVAPKVISEREARTPWNKVTAKYGIQGPEFSCVVVGVDSTGHTVAIMTGLGRNSAEPFETYFSEYLGAVDFLCTDGFPIYDWFCEKHNIAHYVQKSTYRDVLRTKKNEFYERTKTSISEREIRKSLYGKRELDYLDYYHKKLSFEKFEELKREKDLGLIHVDRTHKQMKTYINHPTETFCVEIVSDALTRDKITNEVIDRQRKLGWFVDESKVTDYYDFVWIPSARTVTVRTVNEGENIIIESPDDIYVMELMVVDAKKLQEYIYGIKSREELIQMANNMRATNTRTKSIAPVSICIIALIIRNVR